ncbi:MAG TPA: tyrosine-type recombinase/integrase, partial [Candidatus Angelobacter sp.]|nr:tyrosine-type recombinase/integrase [Candidatus Angelobacter sp.]
QQAMTQAILQGPSTARGMDFNKAIQKAHQDKKELEFRRDDLFDELELRERAMIVCDALTGMRRRELMGLQWCDLDFFGLRVNIVRSVVDQAIGDFKTEASRKPVVMNEHIAQALIAGWQESVYTASTDWVWASPQKCGQQPPWLATLMRYYIQPAARRAGINKKIGWHTFRHVLDPD